MIFIEDVSKSFKTDLLKGPKKVLDRVSFEIQKGSITGFLGANGAGKSTIIKLIMGFISLDQGKINFDESLGKSRESIYSKIGFLPERPYFYPHLTGQEFLTYLGSLNEVSRPIFLKMVEEYSFRLDLKDHLNKKINYYSKGMMQRLGLISCLVHNPLVLILDEPLSGVDPIGRREIKEILLEQNDHGKTIFFSSHILSEVEEMCDRVVVLDSGILKFQGNKKDLLPKKGSFIVKFSGKIEKINPIYVLDIKNRGEHIIIETPEETLSDFLNEIIVQKSTLHSINRKNSTMDEAVYGINK